jgi:hypothetical protein
MKNNRKRLRILNAVKAPKRKQWRQYAQDRNKFGGSSASNADTSGQPKGYSVESKSTPSSVSSAKDKIVSGLEKAAKKVPAYEAIKGIPTSKVVTGLGRAAMLEAGPAIAATVLAESADKYGRERGFGLQPRDVPKSSMSKKSDSIVDAINSDSDASTRANSRAANREAIYGTQKSEPSTPAKKDEPVAVVKKQTTVVSKPKGPTEGDRARAALKEFRDWNASRAPLDSDATTAEDMNTQGKLDAVENVDGMKKGGMTKRPPKPAKKVPPRKFASGGSTSRSSASSRGDGCATKGHTKGKYL